MPQHFEIDLSSYTVAELEEISRSIGREIAKKRARGRRSPSPMVEHRGPVYRNPENSSETWSGKGQRPGWLKEAVARGRRPRSLLS